MNVGAASRDASATRTPLGRLLGRPWFETLLGGLILVTCALTVVQTTSESPLPRVAIALDVIGAFFVSELLSRLHVATSRRSFVREYWLDVVSVLPVLASIRHVPGLDRICGELAASGPLPAWLASLALLRVVRLFRLLKIARHRMLLFPRVLRKGAREVFFASGLVLLAVVIASSALLSFERDANPSLRTFGQAFWFSLYSVVAAEPIPSPPVTLGGHVVAFFVIMTGLFTFATVVGTVTALVTERLRSGDIIVDWEDLRDHLIVCGWNRKAQIILREYVTATPDDDDRPIVVIAEIEGKPQLAPELQRRVQFLNDDFTKIEALEKAGVKRAARAIILSDTARGRKERDADARTILAALTIERLNPDIYTAAEINRREHGHHLEMGKVNDYVVSGEHSAFLLAQSAITRGVMTVFSELLTHEHGHRFSRSQVPASMKGKTFVELMLHVKEKHDALLVAVNDGKDVVLNPSAYVFQGGEDVVLISSKPVRL